MHLPPFELHETDSLEGAVALMDEHGPEARYLAGGTDLLVDLKVGRIHTEHVISLNRIAELKGISVDTKGLRVGSLTTISELNQSPLVSGAYAAIHDASTQMAATQVRNMATIGGNIASAVPCADLPPILLVMNTSVILWSTKGERTVPLDDFFAGPRETTRRPEEVLTAIVVPLPKSGFGAAYERLSPRNGNSIAVASVAASVQLDSSGVIQNAKVALGAVAPVPLLVKGLDEVLIGRRFDDEAALQAAGQLANRASNPISDVRGSVEYRRQMVEVLTRRALEHAATRAREVSS